MTDQNLGWETKQNKINFYLVNNNNLNDTCKGINDTEICMIPYQTNFAS